MAHVWHECVSAQGWGRRRDTPKFTCGTTHGWRLMYATPLNCDMTYILTSLICNNTHVFICNMTHVCICNITHVFICDTIQAFIFDTTNMFICHMTHIWQCGVPVRGWDRQTRTGCSTTLVWHDLWVSRLNFDMTRMWPTSHVRHDSTVTWLTCDMTYVVFVTHLYIMWSIQNDSHMPPHHLFIHDMIHVKFVTKLWFMWSSWLIYVMWSVPHELYVTWHMWCTCPGMRPCITDDDLTYVEFMTRMWCSWRIHKLGRVYHMTCMWRDLCGVPVQVWGRLSPMGYFAARARTKIAPAPCAQNRSTWYIYIHIINIHMYVYVYVCVYI